MSFDPYLFLSGTCRAAFTRYHEIFGGQLELMPMSAAPDQEVPPEHADLIMHAAITLPDGSLLMGSDDPTGDGGAMVGLAVSVSVPDADEATRAFEALADGGQVTMPLAETFWSPMFGMCTDRFGVPWMVSAEPAES